MDRFTDLAHTHRLIEELFLLHQEALLSDRHEALARFDRLRTALERHAALEESVLLPLYDRADFGRGAAPRVFEGEHGKVDRFLDRCAVRLDALDGPRATIAVFDVETRFKGLLEHHFEREEALLFPALDEVTTPPERTKALSPFVEEEQRLAAWVEATT